MVAGIDITMESEKAVVLSHSQVDLLRKTTEHSGGPLGDPSARAFEVFLIVSQSLQVTAQPQGILLSTHCCDHRSRGIKL